MKQPIFAGDKSVIVILRDKTTNTIVTKTPIRAHSSMIFDISEDSDLQIDGIEWDGTLASWYSYLNSSENPV